MQGNLTKELNLFFTQSKRIGLKINILTAPEHMPHTTFGAMDTLISFCKFMQHINLYLFLSCHCF